MSHVKERPKVGDRIEFKYRGVLTGKVHAVAETGVHFTIEMPKEHKLKYRLIGLSTVIRILPEIDFKLIPIEHKPEQVVKT